MTYDLQDYLFDLRGYIILRGAVDPAHVAELNAVIDQLPDDLAYEDWWGDCQRLDDSGFQGLELQNVIEAGAPFERLIDHPSWIERMHRYCGEQGSYVDGLFIDECFASIRRTGGYFPLHSGGEEGQMRNAYRWVHGRWFCGQCNILLALSDIGPGDGGTEVIPGSHKANFAHPDAALPWKEQLERGHNAVEGAETVELAAGDALLFSDAMCHGASARTNPGERRVVIYRYGPSWGSTRHGYRYSEELLARLTPERRQILQPVAPRTRGG